MCLVSQRNLTLPVIVAVSSCLSNTSKLVFGAGALYVGW